MNKQEEHLTSISILVAWYREAKQQSKVKSWRDLARQANVNPSILSLWKREGRLPGDETIYSLATALDKDPTPLLKAVIRERSDRKQDQLIRRYGDMAIAALRNEDHGSEQWEMLMSLLDQLPIGFFVLDLDEMSFLHVNQYLCEIFGIQSKSDIEGHTLCDFFSVDESIFPQRKTDDEALHALFNVELASGENIKVLTTSIGCIYDSKHLSVGLLKCVKDFSFALSKKEINLSIKKDMPTE